MSKLAGKVALLTGAARGNYDGSEDKAADVVKAVESAGSKAVTSRSRPRNRGSVLSTLS